MAKHVHNPRENTAAALSTTSSSCLCKSNEQIRGRQQSKLNNTNDGISKRAAQARFAKQRQEQQETQEKKIKDLKCNKAIRQHDANE